MNFPAVAGVIIKITKRLDRFDVLCLIKYYDRFYTSQQVMKKAMKDLKKGKTVSIMGFPDRL